MKKPGPHTLPAAPVIDRRQPQPDLLQGPTRYWDPQFKMEVLRVPPGGFALAEKEGDMLATVVGSCVAACVRDPDTGMGGMNHFMQTAQKTAANGANGGEMHAGHRTMENLLQALYEKGAKKERLEIRLFGGASLFRSSLVMGDENIRFVRNYLEGEGLAAVAEDLGGVYPRRIHYVPVSGRVFRLTMRRSDDARIFSRELELRLSEDR